MGEVRSRRDPLPSIHPVMIYGRAALLFRPARGFGGTSRVGWPRHPPRVVSWRGAWFVQRPGAAICPVQMPDRLQFQWFLAHAMSQRARLYEMVQKQLIRCI